MKDRKLLFILYVATILSTGELFVIGTTITPKEASSEVLWVLFLCLWVFIGSIGTFVWHPVKSLIYRSTSLARIVSARQAFLFSLVITAILFFKSLSIFNLWDIVPLAISTILIEFFFQADKTNPAS